MYSVHRVPAVGITDYHDRVRSHRRYITSVGIRAGTQEPLRKHFTLSVGTRAVRRRNVVTSYDFSLLDGAATLLRRRTAAARHRVPPLKYR